MYEGYEGLANAIIIQAAKDYRKAVKKCSICPHDIDARKLKRNCERFFNSIWCNQLSEVDGKYILRKLKEERR